MPTLIHNTSSEPVTLPAPLKGTLRAGQRVLIDVARSTVLAVLGGERSIKTTAVSSAGPFDSYYAGDLVAGIPTASLADGSVTTAKIADANVTLAKVADAVLTPTKMAVQDSLGVGVPFVIRKVFAAGAGGAASDVALLTANAPFKLRILDLQLLVTTLVALSTLTLRTALAGGGSAITDAMLGTALGVVRPLTLANTLIAAAGSLVLRLSDSALAGEITVNCVRET